MSALILASVLGVGVGLSLGMLGAGGSILTLPILVYVLHLDEHAAITSSLVVVGVTSLVAMIPHARAGHVDLRVGLSFASAGAVGAFGGGLVAGLLPPRPLLYGFLTVMAAAGLAMLLGRRVEAPPRPASLPHVLLAGAGTGAMTGLVGAGGGFVVVPALTLFGGLDLRKAVGTSLLVISLNTLAGFLGHAAHATLEWRATLAVTGSAVVGSLVGEAFSQRVPQQALRKGFGAFVLVMAVVMAVMSA